MQYLSLVPVGLLVAVDMTFAIKYFIAEMRYRRYVNTLVYQPAPTYAENGDLPIAHPLVAAIKLGARIDLTRFVVAAAGYGIYTLPNTATKYYEELVGCAQTRAFVTSMLRHLSDDEPTRISPSDIERFIEDLAHNAQFLSFCAQYGSELVAAIETCQAVLPQSNMDGLLTRGLLPDAKALEPLLELPGEDVRQQAA